MGTGVNIDASAAERVRASASAVEGWLSDEQGGALYTAAASTTGAGAIVEIGSWKGRSTVWLAAGARIAGRRVYAIDPHAGSREDPAANTLAEFQTNIDRAGLSGAVEPFVMTSSAAAAQLAGPVELLFVDGDHMYPAVRQDGELWLPRVVDGGIVMFHDVATSGYSGPRRVFRRLVCWNRGFDRIAFVGSMGVARRTGRRRARDGRRATVLGLRLYLYDLKRLFRVRTLATRLASVIRRRSLQTG